MTLNDLKAAMEQQVVYIEGTPALGYSNFRGQVKKVTENSVTDRVGTIKTIMVELDRDAGDGGVNHVNLSNKSIYPISEEAQVIAKVIRLNNVVNSIKSEDV